ncbi:MAG TPA: hypothetical protein VNZ55_13415 [Thermomicrobiales bacterium]|nr:hypothetical protein [Thermomicrobiales bacterium]
MLRLLLAVVLVWLLFTFTQPILDQIAQVVAWVTSHIDVTVTW